MQPDVFGVASRRPTHLTDREPRSGRLFIYLFFKQQNKTPKMELSLLPQIGQLGIFITALRAITVFSCVRGEIRRNFTLFMFCFFVKGSGEFHYTQRSAVKADFCGTVPSAGFIFLSWTNTAPNRWALVQSKHLKTSKSVKAEFWIHAFVDADKPLLHLHTFLSFQTSHKSGKYIVCLSKLFLTRGNKQIVRLR